MLLVVIALDVYYVYYSTSLQTPSDGWAYAAQPKSKAAAKAAESVKKWKAAEKVSTAADIKAAKLRETYISKKTTYARTLDSSTNPEIRLNGKKDAQAALTEWKAAQAKAAKADLKESVLEAKAWSDTSNNLSQQYKNAKKADKPEAEIKGIHAAMTIAKNMAKKTREDAHIKKLNVASGANYVPPRTPLQAYYDAISAAGGAKDFGSGASTAETADYYIQRWPNATYADYQQSGADYGLTVANNGIFTQAQFDNMKAQPNSGIYGPPPIE